MTLLDLGSLFVGDPIHVPNPGRLVRDVLLIERWGLKNFILRESAFVALSRGGGSVGCSRGHVGEEGLVLRCRPPNEVAGLLGENVGEEVPFLAAVGDLLTVLVDAVVVELLPVELAVPLVPARRDVGPVPPPVTVEVFAEESGPVAALLKAGGYRILFGPIVTELLEASGRGTVALYAAVVGVEAGEDGGPRGATDREAHEGVLEGGALVAHKGADLGHLLGRGVVKVIGENEDYVR